MLLVLTIILLGCNEIESKQKNINDLTKVKTEIMNPKASLSIQELMLLTKSKAIEKYGAPSSQEQFMLDDAQGEFRNAISDKYTEKERQSESILVEEVTWEKSEDTWITVWYEVIGQSSKPKDSYLWIKGTEF